MAIFLSVALLIYASMHLYAFGKVWKVCPNSKALRLGLLAASVVLTVAPFLVRFLETQDYHQAAIVMSWIAYTWMGYLLLFFGLGLFFDLCRVIARLLKLKWPLSALHSLCVTGLMAFVLLGYGFFEAQQIRIEEITITTPKLASGQVTIAQISDLHLGLMIRDRYLDRVVAKLKEINPDIVVATGDIVDGQGDHLNSLAQHFQAYKPPLGAYAVTGNHEYYVGLDHSLRFLRNSGFTVLRAESARVGGIVLMGVDDFSIRSSGQAKTDLRPALAGVTANDFVVLLKHRPVIDRDTPFDLQLSGHTHGGQIFPMTYPVRLINGFPTGLIQLEQGRQLYVNRGLGTWGPPIRLFVSPEITLITIKSQPLASTLKTPIGSAR